MIAEDRDVSEVPLKNADGRLASTLSYFVVAAGLTTFLFTLFVSVRCYSPVWFEDQWNLNVDPILFFGAHHPIQFFWVQHNEHRIPILKVLNAIDFHLFHGSNWFLLVCSWATQITMLVLSSYVVIKFGSFHGWQRRTLLGLLLFCEFNPAQLENFTWAFQSTFFLVSAFTLASICCLAIYADKLKQQPDQNHSKYLWLCVGAAFLAECSIASGLICWVILPLCIGLLGLKRTLVRPIVAFGVLAVGVYLVGYHSPSEHTQPGDALRRPFEILTYIQTYFGASWDYLSKNFGMFVSPIAISYLAAIGIKSFWRPGRKNALYAVAISMTMVCLLTAGMTALGRLNFGANQASASRYQTPAMLFWCFGAIVFILCATEPRRQGRLLMVQIACLTLFAFQVKAYGAILAENDAGRFSRDVAGLALESGVDTRQVRSIFPYLTPIKWYRIMRERKLIGPFFPECSYVGKSVTSVYKIASQRDCQGNLDIVQVLDNNPSDVSVAGWASVPSLLGRPSTIILATNDDRIVGIGLTGIRRPDVIKAGMLPSRETNSGWYGLAKLAPGEVTIRAYEQVNGGKEVCLLGGQKTIGK
jgi:hypothetical protein